MSSQIGSDKIGNDPLLLFAELIDALEAERDKANAEAEEYAVVLQKAKSALAYYRLFVLNYDVLSLPARELGDYRID